MQSVVRKDDAIVDQGFPFCIAYLDSSQASQALADERAMAVIGFAAKTAINDNDPRQFWVGLPELNGHNTIEVWYSERALQTEYHNGLYFAANEDVVFARLLVDEADYPDLDAASHAAYQRIFAFCRQHDYPHIVRMWNYFPDINQEFDGMERYRAFCEGRYRVLEKELADFEAMLPAACAIGTRSPGFLIYFLATRQPGVQIENPRQMSAFHYPPQYGLKSPSFSRSILKRWGKNQRHLYISGTASIVGHVTKHAQDVSAQLQETLANLEALLANANRYAKSPFRPVLFKVYMRHNHNIDALRNLIAQRFGANIPTVFLQGDFCRRDLLIEIEGMGISSDEA